MDFWASLEHKLKYKKDVNDTEEIEAQLRACADSIEKLDYQMQDIRDKIDLPGAKIPYTEVVRAWVSAGNFGKTMS